MNNLKINHKTVAYMKYISDLYLVKIKRLITNKNKNG
tara:strand:+ start:1001 stop:1111 length:111 start_codon:yes stop_codon:yes gene_type:complete